MPPEQDPALAQDPVSFPVPDEDQPTPAELVRAQVAAAPTPLAKAETLLSLPAEARYLALAELPAPMVAAIIDADPERTATLIANLPAPKFTQIVNLGTFAQGRGWLEKAVASGTLAGAILPSLLNGNDLANMLLSDPDVRRALPSLLNYDRAERWRRLLTTAEWHASVDQLLMSDADELLAKVSFKNKALKAVMASLLDFVPELYLETVNLALERAKRQDDVPDEWENLTSAPLSLADLENAPAAEDRTAINADVPSPLTDAMPEGGDPVFALATAGLSGARKSVLEEQLKGLLRQEIVATASFGTADIQRAAGRVLFSLRAGLESFGPSVEDATRALETRSLPEISVLGARVAEGYRQRALALSGQRDFLDSRQRHFLDAMKQPEAGVHPETREPVLFLMGRKGQPRAEWHPTPLVDVTARLADITAWSGLARAVFGTDARVHAIFQTAKTRTFDEALRRTVLALTLYRRWEPELVRPAEDYAAFRRQYGTGVLNGMDAARQIVLDALDSTPSGAWKPSDAKARARDLLLRAVREVETMPLPSPAPPSRTSR